MDATIKRLLTWYTRHGRTLPWRTTRNAYRIFMSELMLQQTQVDRVIPKYQAWLKRFPTWEALAAAQTADLIHAWAGLGYNRRALYARESAKIVVAHGVPVTEAEWRKLKGVGPYMAAALTEFVNHARALVIDTNVRRVVGRVFLGIPFPRPTDDSRILAILERVTPQRGNHWDLPQAFMDLANDACGSRIPRCEICPLKATCQARSKFASGKLLPKKRVPMTERIHAEKKYPDRIYRGRILSLVRERETVRLHSVGQAIDETFDQIADADWLRAIVSRLEKDGLLAIGAGDILSLPHS